MVKQGEKKGEKKEEKNRQSEKNCDGKRGGFDRKRVRITLKKGRKG